ncbi:MAG: endo-1,4-beta-xylanase [Bacteroidales bacterium]|nr:endo-1,4-beta-xylanase [Bacteroidales bacterium]
MKKKIQNILSILFFAGPAISAQIPEGGIRLNAETGATFQQVGNCVATEVAVEGQPFTKAIKVEVGSDIENTWSAQVKFPAIEGIEDGDVLFVAFYARTIYSPEETGEGNVNVIVEENSSPYAKEISYNITIGNEWKQYYASAVSGTTLSSSQVSYLFHCGFPDQVIEVADVKYLNYKQTLTLDDLPETEITYYGQDPDAAWRAPAAERIGQIRKGMIDFTVYDENGQIAEGAEISVKMKQHQFGFGTAISANEFNSNETYRNKIFEMFNEVVFENDLKWPQFSINNTAHITQVMDSLDKYDIPVRGHNIIWPSWRHMPSYVETLKDDPQGLRNAIDNRIDQVTQYTRGRLNDWDVINEPYTEHDIMDILGNEVMADWFKRARQNDRNVKLYLNDYSIISSGGKNTVKQDYYYNLVQEIGANGGEVDGIGLQGHMSSELTSITKVYDIIDRFAQLGKEIKITEHDINITQRGVQADYTRDFLTITFSHEAVKSVLVWGFWAGRHWKPESAFFAEDWSIRPHGEMWNEMIYNQWWTPDTILTTDASGIDSRNGFLGTYEYTVSYGGKTRTGTFELKNSFQSGKANEVVLSLDTAFPEAVEINSSIEGFLCQGDTATLSVHSAEGLTYSWTRNGVELTETEAEILASEPGNYMVTVNKGSMSVTSPVYALEVRSAPVAEISATGDTTLCGGRVLELIGNAAEGTTLSWRKNGSQIAVNKDTLNVFESGTYSLVTSLNGCTNASEPLIVSVKSNPEAKITVTGDNPLCEGESVYLMGTISPGLSYRWFKEDVELDVTERLIEVFESGTFVVETTLGECSSISEPVEIVVNPVPEAVITAEGDLTFCEGGSVVLTGNEDEGLLYTWMLDGNVLEGTGQSIEALESGSYTLMTTLLNCSAVSDPVLVTVLPSTDPNCTNSIAENTVQSTVYPNPFSGSFIIEISDRHDNETLVELYNVNGKIVYSEPTKPAAGPVRVAVTEPGLYFLHIQSDKASEVHKLSAQ